MDRIERGHHAALSLKHVDKLRKSGPRKKRNEKADNEQKLVAEKSDRKPSEEKRDEDLECHHCLGESSLNQKAPPEQRLLRRCGPRVPQQTARGKERRCEQNVTNSRPSKTRQCRAILENEGINLDQKERRVSPVMEIRDQPRTLFCPAGRRLPVRRTDLARYRAELESIHESRSAEGRQTLRRKIALGGILRHDIVSIRRSDRIYARDAHAN
jgi:hypothetical protein